MASGRSSTLPFALRLEGAPGKHYYELKNHAAPLCSAEVVVFIDSDVVPEKGWLMGLLDSFRHPGIDVVGGTAYIEASTFYARSFALFWFFPLRTEQAGLRTSTSFFANNLAVRRELFVANPYPSLPQFRGQCAALAEQLVAIGAGVFTRCDARVSHPPPNGAKHFVFRALAHGHDDVAAARRKNIESGSLWWTYVQRLPARLKMSARCIRYGRKQLQVNVLEAGGALVLAVTFELLRCVGAILSCERDNFLLQRIRV